MARIWDIQREHKGRLLAGDTDLAKQMTATWAYRVREIERELQALLQLIDQTSGGDKVPASWLLRQERYQALIRQIRSEIQRWSQGTSDVIIRARENAIRAAVVDAKELISAGRGQDQAAGSFGAFNGLSVEAMEAQAGFLADGSPLSELFIAISEEGAALAGKVLLSAIVSGLSASQTSKKLQDALGTPLSRSLRIARTETLRSYRTAAIDTFAEDGIERWQWVASHSYRTCPACLGMSGKLFPVTVPFGSHVNCRCTPCPWFPDMEPFQSGQDWFDEQDEDEKREVLGDAMYEVVKANKLLLSDLVGIHNSEQWGTSRYTRSVKDVLSHL